MIPIAIPIAYLAPLLSRLAPIRAALSDLATEARRVLDREAEIRELRHSNEQLVAQADALDAAGQSWAKEALTEWKRAEAAEAKLAASVSFAEVLPVLRAAGVIVGAIRGPGTTMAQEDALLAAWDAAESLRARVEAAERGETP